MKKIVSLVTAFVMVAALAAGFGSAFSRVSAAEEDTVSVLFTHDMHSHLETEEQTRDGKTTESGGFAKIKTVKDDVEKNYPGTFLLDAGDFSMGTPFQTIFKSDAAELSVMAQIGYDATTFGNHEFDYGAAGLADMLNTAAKYDSDDYTMPAIVGTNINWEATLSDEEAYPDGQKLKKAFDNYGVEDYTIIEKNGVRMAIFGVIGDEAISNAPEAGLAFSDYVKRAQKIVDEIEENGDADIIVALSHAGTNEDDFSSSEDVKLAKEVKGIDLIISGHSHTVLDEAQSVGDTTIVSCGEYTDNVGHLVLEKSGDSYKVSDYQIIKLDGSVKNDSDVQRTIEGFKSTVNSKFFSDYGYSYDEVLAESDFAFTDIGEFGKQQGEEPLANLISDSYIYAVKQAEGSDSEPVTASIIPAGTVRASFDEGDITVADAFNVSSLGMGADGSVGYPVVSIYLTGKELKTAAEVDASISPGMGVARLYMSGIGYTINDKRLFLNRATDVAIIDNEGNEIEKLDNDKLYRVVGGLYSCQMLSIVKDQSHGLLSIEPKDKDGNVITDFTEHIVKDRDGQELKEWYALASYIDSFEGNSVPDYYSTTHNRKVVDNSLNPVKLFKQPNHIAIMLTAIILIPVVIIVGIIVAFVKRRNARRGFAKSMFSGNRNRGYKRTMSSRGVRPSVRHRKMSMKGRKRRF